MSGNRLLVLLLLTGLFLVACQGKAADPCNTDGALLVDDFSGEESCGWAEYSRNGASAEIADGALMISSSQPGQLWWTNPGRSYGDVIIAVSAEPVTGPDDNAYGIICRYQDPENFYVFLVSGDGYYAIGRYQSGSDQINYLTGDGEYVASEVINQGTGRNQLEAVCVGNELALRVNGAEVARVTDTTFTTGDVGLAASSFQPGILEVRFDDLRIGAP